MTGKDPWCGILSQTLDHFSHLPSFSFTRVHVRVYLCNVVIFVFWSPVYLQPFLCHFGTFRIQIPLDRRDWFCTSSTWVSFIGYLHPGHALWMCIVPQGRHWCRTSVLIGLLPGQVVSLRLLLCRVSTCPLPWPLPRAITAIMRER